VTVSGLEETILQRKNNDVFFHLKEMLKSSAESLDSGVDFAEVTSRLIEIVCADSTQSLNSRIKRGLAVITHRCMQKVFLLQFQACANQQLLRVTIETWIEAILNTETLVNEKRNH
jgi:hypothetical protein